MESRQSLVWNHHGVMYVINPKEKYTLMRDAIRLRRFLCHLPYLERWLWGKNKRVSIYLSALYSLTLQTPCTMHQELYVFDPKDTLKQVVCVRLYISCSYLLPSLMAVFYQSNCPPNEQFKKIILLFRKNFLHRLSPFEF